MRVVDMTLSCVEMGYGLNHKNKVPYSVVILHLYNCISIKVSRMLIVCLAAACCLCVVLTQLT